MGRREGLVQVHVDHVEAHVAGADLAQDGVQVGAVVVEQPAGLVHGGGDGLDVAVEHADGARVGQHDAGGLRADRVAQRRDVHVAVAAGGDLAHVEAGHDGRGRVGAVGGIGHQDLAPGRVAAGVVVGADHHDAGELALGAGGRREGHRMHAGDDLQHVLQLMQAGHDALAVRLRRRRMPGQKARQRRQAVAGPRVVLHRAGAERVEVRVDGKVLLRQARVVAHRLELRHLRQGRAGLAAEPRRQVRHVRPVRRNLGGGHAAGTGLFLDQHAGRSGSCCLQSRRARDVRGCRAAASVPARRRRLVARRAPQAPRRSRALRRSPAPTACRAPCRRHR